MRLVCLAIALAVPCLFAAKAPITHEDVWMMKTVGAPAASPDGKWAVFSVSEPSYNTAEASSDLWIVPTDGSQPARRLTHTESRREQLQPGARIAARLLSPRNARETTSHRSTFSIFRSQERRSGLPLSAPAPLDPHSAPMARMLLFQSSVYPGAVDDAANKKIAAEIKARKYKARVYESFPVRYWDRWLDETQRHISCSRWKPDRGAKDLLARDRSWRPGQDSAARSRTHRRIWGPSGLRMVKSIVFSATDTRNQSAYANVISHLIRGGCGRR